MAKRPRLVSLQKLPELGFPITSFNFQGDLKALVWISRSEATENHSLETQADRARSISGSFSKMLRRMSLHTRASKFEFIGDRTVVSPPSLAAAEAGSRV